MDDKEKDTIDEKSVVEIIDEKDGKDGKEIQDSSTGEKNGAGNHDVQISVMEINENATDEDKVNKEMQPCLRMRTFLKKVSPLICLISIRLKLNTVLQAHRKQLTILVRILLSVLYLAYFIYAMVYRFGDEGSVRLLVLTAVISVGFILHVLKKRFGNQMWKYIQDKCRDHRPSNRTKFYIKLIIGGVVFLGILLFLIFGVFVNQPYNLVPATGLVVFILTLFFLSHEPQMVTWRPVLWGLLLQLVFAIIVLRTKWGYEAFDWLGKRVVEYLDHTDYGAKFMFGNGFMEHFFAFKVLPVIFFFSATIAMLYYLGWMQIVIEKLAVVMQYSLGTSALESLHAAVNVFVGWGETTTLVRPYFDQMTLSELHTIMTNGFATVAGSTLVIYALYGAPANHLISASVMSAPAALGISKLFWPENKRVGKKLEDTMKSYRLKREGYNLVDAASAGAITAIPVVAYIFASVIVFFSLLDFVNSTLAWLGERVGLIPPDYPVLSFQLICSYLFWPLVFLMGVEIRDCRTVARMVGIKTFINEFLAYEDLGNVIKNGGVFQSFNGSWHYDSAYNIVLEGTNTTLVGGVISKRSETIATYALCGFANVTALGIMIGALTAVAPSRKKDIVRVSTRALISGTMACFVTACIAGILGQT